METHGLDGARREASKIKGDAIGGADPANERRWQVKADALTGLSLGAVAINSPKGVSYECEIYDCWVLNRRGRLNVDLFSRRLVRQRLTSLRLKHPGGQKSGRPCSQSE